MQKLWRVGVALAIAGATAISTAAMGATDPASGSSHVVISEVETGTTASASQEFVELYNPTGSSITVNGWTVEYKAATSTDTAANWVKHATLAGTIVPYGFYLVAPKTYLAMADADWSATLAGSGGNLRVRDDSGEVIDQLGYGTTANAAEGGAPALAPAAGQSLERLPGRLDELDGNGVDTDVNAADFILRTDPQPQSSESLPEPPGADDSDLVVGSLTDPTATTDSDSDTSEAAAADDSAPADESYAPVDITELLVNPMTPFTDAHDEFVELYNPTDSPIDLAGYTIRAGSKFHSYYVLPDTTLSPGTYTAFYSSQTKVAMPNDGGAVEVLDPTGMVVDVTPPYGAAPEGQSWARFDDGWHWTLQLTPGQPNVLATAVTLAPATSTKAAKAARKTSPKAAATKKAKAKKVTVKHPRTKKPKATTPKLPAELTAAHSLQPATWLIIGLAALTIGYALYEFRYDIQALYYRACGNRPAGEDDRAPIEGQNGD
ncbi:MAG TPA: lamin tail domain-containing protein [Candidatus Saccharimonadales bacterium]|nr:lamin tail domain-containing protein [Candidatus Saccharimonadales bacterium]